MYFIWSLNSHFRWIQPSAERVGDTSDAFIMLGPSSRTGTSHQLNLGGALQNKTCAAATAPSCCAFCSALTLLALRGLRIYILPDASNWLLHLPSLPSLIWSRSTSGAQEASGSSSKQQIKAWDLLKNNPAKTKIWTKANSLFHVETLFWFLAWLEDDRGVLCTLHSSQSKVTQTWKVHNQMCPAPENMESEGSMFPGALSR